MRIPGETIPGKALPGWIEIVRPRGIICFKPTSGNNFYNDLHGLRQHERSGDIHQRGRQDRLCYPARMIVQIPKGNMPSHGVRQDHHRGVGFLWDMSVHETGQILQIVFVGLHIALVTIRQHTFG